jgi:hypothetical protein
MNSPRALITRALAIATVLVLGCFTSTAQADSPADSTPQASTPNAAPAGATQTTDPPAAAGPHRTIWPWIIISTGAALIVTATVLEIHAVKEDDRHDQDEEKLFSIPTTDTATRKPIQDSADEHEKSATNTRTAALIVGSVGFIAVAGAVLLWFYEGSKGGEAPADPAKPAAKINPSLLPSFGPGYAGAAFGASF